MLNNIALIGTNNVSNLLSSQLSTMPNKNLQLIADPLNATQLTSNTDAIILTQLTDELIFLLALLNQQSIPILFCLDDFPLTPIQEKQLITIDKKYHSLFYFGFKKRFSTSIAFLKRQLEKATIGEIQIIKIIERSNKTTSWRESCLELIDLVYYLTGEEISQVFAMNSQHSASPIIINLKLASGAVIVIDINTHANYGYDFRLEIFGSLGTLQLPTSSPIKTKRFTNENIHFSPLPKNDATIWLSAYQAMLANFEHQPQVLPRLDDYCKAKLILKSIENSIIENNSQILIPATTQGETNAAYS